MAAVPPDPPLPAPGAAPVPDEGLPPGQYVPPRWPVLHYGPVPRFDPERWDFYICGASVGRGELRLSWGEFAALPRAEVQADFHCVTGFSMLANTWHGVPTSVILDLLAPAPGVTHVMVWGEYGYSANMRLSDFVSGGVFATHRNGEQLSPEHGFPVRLVVPRLYAWKGPKWARAVEYLVADRRGFWEERGYHNAADPWREQRYAYQELPAEGPAARLR